MVEFAQMHVKLALEEIADNAELEYIGYTPFINRESILNYDYNKIK